MSERVPRIFSQTNQIDDAVTLFANRTIFEGWEEVSITRQLNTIASSFSLGFTDKWRVDQESFRLRNGNSARINFGQTLMLNGYVDKVDFNLTAQQRSLNASGRSRTGDLVDCSITGPIEFVNQTIQTIVEKLLEPFGISLIMRAPAGAPFDKIVFRQGETVFEAIDRLARERSLIMIPAFNGNLILEQRGTRRAATELRQGVNVLSASANFDNTNRFSEYTVKGQGPATRGTAEDATQPTAKATDQGITRFRPTVIVAENSIDNGSAIDRARYEANLRAAKASTITVEVQGWFQQDGTPWDVNLITAVDIGFIGVRREMLISKCTYQKGNGGTKTQIELIRSDAFQFDTSNIPMSNDPVDSLGWEKR